MKKTYIEPILEILSFESDEITTDTVNVSMGSGSIPGDTDIIL